MLNFTNFYYFLARYGSVVIMECTLVGSPCRLQVDKRLQLDHDQSNESCFFEYFVIQMKVLKEYFSAMIFTR